MKKILCLVLLGLISIHLVGCSGWAINTSTSTQPRVDQEISGNRGTIYGQDTSEPKKPTFTERKVYRVEVELPQWPEKLKFKKWNWKKIFPIKPRQPKREDKAIWGNKGNFSQGSQNPPVEETITYYGYPEVKSIEIPTNISKETELAPGEKSSSVRTYKAKKGDTLQKISRKFYGTTKKWIVIYKANRTTLKTPDSLYPGNVLIIPQISEFEK